MARIKGTTHIDGTHPLWQKIVWLFTGKRLFVDDRYRLTCPRCGSKMEKIVKEKIIIDICPYCKGIFLDDGEIDKLVALGTKGGIHGKEKKQSK